MGWGIKIPKISVPSLSTVGRNINREVNNQAHASTHDFKNAGRGEVGKYVGGIGQSVYNIAAAPVRAVGTGQYGKQLGVVVGSAGNLASGGTLDYAAHSSGIQRSLNSDNIFGKNLAAISRVTSSGGRGDAVSNADRNLAWQGAAKIGATAAVAYGGYSAYSYFAGNAGADAASAALTADSTLPSAAAMSAYTPEAAAATESAAAYAEAGIGSAGVEAAAGTTAAATAGTSLSSYATYAGVGALGYKALTGKTLPGTPGADGSSTDTGGFWDAVNHLISGSTSSPSPRGGVVEAGVGSGLMSGPIADIASSSGGVVLLAAAAAAFVVAKKARVI